MQPPRAEAASAAELDGEIGAAWAILARSVDHAVPVFAFPFGQFDDAARAAVARAGLPAACTVELGRNWLAVPLDALRRVEVRGDTGRLAFRLAVWRGKPWLPGLRGQASGSARAAQSASSSSRSQVTTPS